MNGSGEPGTMIVVVGPSGAGKDSLIDFARQRLAREPGIGFVRRFITRHSEAGSEDHSAVSPEEFEVMRQAGRFAVHWGAHGLSYGIPADTLDEIAAGRTLVANGSRAAIAEFLKVYSSTLVITVSADPDIIARRLAARGRETADEIQRRLLRSASEWDLGCRQVVIDNSGRLETAGDAFVSALLAAARDKAPAIPLAGRTHVL